DPSATEEYNQDKGRHQAESVGGDTKTSDITSENRDVHASSLFRTGDDATRETAATPSPSSPTTTLAVAEKNSQTPHPASATPARDVEASEQGETNIGPLKTAKGQTMERTAGAAERRIDVPAPLEGTKESSDEKTALPSSRSAPSDHGPPAVASTTVTVGSEPDDTRQESSNQPLKGENKVPPPGTASRLPVPPHLPSSSDQRSSSLVTAASSTKEIPPIVQNSPGAIENGGGLPQQITSPLSNSVDKPRTSTSTATSAVAAATTIIAMRSGAKVRPGIKIACYLSFPFLSVERPPEAFATSLSVYNWMHSNVGTLFTAIYADSFTPLIWVNAYLSAPFGTKPATPRSRPNFPSNRLRWAIFHLALRAYEAESALARFLGSDDSVGYEGGRRAQGLSEEQSEATPEEVVGRATSMRDHLEESVDQTRPQSDSHITYDISPILPRRTNSMHSTGDSATHGTAITPTPPSMSSLVSFVELAKQRAGDPVPTVPTLSVDRSKSEQRDGSRLKPAWRDIEAAPDEVQEGGSGASQLRRILMRSQDAPNLSPTRLTSSRRHSFNVTLPVNPVHTEIDFGPQGYNNDSRPSPSRSDQPRGILRPKDASHEGPSQRPRRRSSVHYQTLTIDIPGSSDNKEIDVGLQDSPSRKMLRKAAKLKPSPLTHTAIPPRNGDPAIPRTLIDHSEREHASRSDENQSQSPRMKRSREDADQVDYVPN
ncbi:hypothetical protein FRB98_002876, partial [Tulasnella sp. 332]